ncbi:MAG: M20 family metallopeptidase [Sedimentisphaerales bacterium]|nr:M20 family metallopeptidase [Sedimentisphaerales bacterium]
MKEFFKKLINAESTPEKGESASAKVLAEEFGKSGINCRIDSWEKNRANITAELNCDSHKKALLFACHLDVVGPGEERWERPAFEAVESEGKIYGRGSVDMKGPTAACVTAIRQVVDSGVKLQGDIIFTAVAGEETDSCGAKRFVNDYDKIPDCVGIVIPEPTDFSIVTAHRGMFWLEITTKGRAAHGSTPHLGINAINSMRLFLNELENYEIPAKPHRLLGNCSMSVNTIEGGKALNVVPDKCKIRVDIRTLPEQNHSDIISDIEKIFAKIKTENSQFEAEVSVVREVQPLETDCNCDFIRDFCSAVGIDETVAIGFTTDGPHFAPFEAPVVIFGPGKPKLCHKPNEYIEINDMEKAVEYYKKIILKFLS